MNSKYGDVLLSLKNAAPHEIPKYPSQVMEEAIAELNEANNELKDLKRKQKSEDLSEEDKLFLTAKTIIKIDTIYRLKRFMLVALNKRCEKIENSFWKFGGEIQIEELSSMSETEKAYLLEYKDLVNTYMDETDLELMTDLEPPIDSIVEIRVINDCNDML